MLLAYHKVTKNKPDTFFSNNQLATARRGHPRPRRERNRGGTQDPTTLADPSASEAEGGEAATADESAGPLSTPAWKANPMWVPLPQERRVRFETCGAPTAPGAATHRRSVAYVEEPGSSSSTSLCPPRSVALSCRSTVAKSKARPQAVPSSSGQATERQSDDAAEGCQAASPTTEDRDESQPTSRGIPTLEPKMMADDEKRTVQPHQESLASGPAVATVDLGANDHASCHFSPS